MQNSKYSHVSNLHKITSIMDAMIACKYCRRLRPVIYVNIVRFEGKQNPIRSKTPENKHRCVFLRESNALQQQICSFGIVDDGVVEEDNKYSWFNF